MNNENQSSSLAFPWRYLAAHLSFTRFVIDHIKGGQTKQRAGQVLRRWNWLWFLAESTLAIMLCWISVRVAVKDWPWWARELLLLIAFWRINEIAWAFYKDSLDRIRGSAQRSDIEPHERVPMLMRSTVGLVVQFSVVYFCAIPGEGFSECLTDFRDALYFSATVATSVGQEGQEVKDHLLRTAHVYQSALSILLLVLALSIYVGDTSQSKRGSRSI